MAGEGVWLPPLVVLALERVSSNIDTPTAGSGGILASTRLAWCPRSYDRSTSVLLLGMPYREVCNTDLMALTTRRTSVWN